MKIDIIKTFSFERYYEINCLVQTLEQENQQLNLKAQQLSDDNRKFLEEIDSLK